MVFVKISIKKIYFLVEDNDECKIIMNIKMCDKKTGLKDGCYVGSFYPASAS